MSNARRGQPAPNEPPHPFPGDARCLAPPPQRPVPESPHVQEKIVQARVARISNSDRLRILAELKVGLNDKVGSGKNEALVMSVRAIDDAMWWLQKYQAQGHP